MHEHASSLHAHVERRHLFDKWRRRRAGVGIVLVAVPGTGDAAVHDLPLAKRPVLMLADIGDGGYFSVIFENRHAFAGEADDAGAVLSDVVHSAGIHKTIVV